ncbi:hypothetical protein, partial [Pseudomonas aeruginosa]|uniref:hypothetical protein n=1 Tax=Pseudomonas aeruginosa TaxID=287 RepID=UPI0024978ABA
MSTVYMAVNCSQPNPFPEHFLVICVALGWPGKPIAIWRKTGAAGFSLPEGRKKSSEKRVGSFGQLAAVSRGPGR